MTDPAIRAERAHVMRRDPAADDWPFTGHRTQAEIIREELDAAVDRAAAKVAAAFDMATRP